MLPRIYVLIESHYDPTEAPAFEMFFPACGYEIEFVSDLRGAKSRTFMDNDGRNSVHVTTDLDGANLDESAGLILIGGYAMDMLRYQVHVTGEQQPNEPRATQFLRYAMSKPNLVVGTICHSLWLFTPAPDLLKNRQVTCAHNIMFDIQNAGAKLVYDETTKMLADVHVDGNLVTARHPYVVQAFMNAFVRELNSRRCST
jgi:putative intracellular protease/amidase